MLLLERARKVVVVVESIFYAFPAAAAAIYSECCHPPISTTADWLSNSEARVRLTAYTHTHTHTFALSLLGKKQSAFYLSGLTYYFYYIQALLPL